MGNYVPVHDGGQKPFTYTATTAVTGGRLVEVNGASGVGHATAASRTVVGVAAFDAAAGAKVTVWPLEGLIHELSATAAVAVGAGVQAGAAGEASTVAAGAAATDGTLQTVVGVALTAAAGVGSKFRVLGRRG